MRRGEVPPVDFDNWSVKEMTSVALLEDDPDGLYLMGDSGWLLNFVGDEVDDGTKHKVLLRGETDKVHTNSGITIGVCRVRFVPKSVVRVLT